MIKPAIADKLRIALYILIALALGVTFLANLTLKIELAQSKTALVNEKLGRQTDRTNAERAAKEGIAAARAEDQLRIKDQKEVINEYAKTIKVVRADAADARGSADSMRQRADELAVGCSAAPGRADPGAPGGGAPAGSPGGVLANMLVRIDQDARGVAEFADEATTSGAACERAYDALRRRQ